MTQRELDRERRIYYERGWRAATKAVIECATAARLIAPRFDGDQVQDAIAESLEQLVDALNGAWDDATRGTQWPDGA